MSTEDIHLVRDGSVAQGDGAAESPVPGAPRRVAAALGAATAIALGVVVWLFGTAPPELEKPAFVESLPAVDGTLLVVEPRRLVLEAFAPVDGQREIEFVIRERDASHFDLAHLRSHSSVALPTRLYYQRDGDTWYAVYKEDAPANSRRDAEASQ